MICLLTQIGCQSVTTTPAYRVPSPINFDLYRLPAVNGAEPPTRRAARTNAAVGGITRVAAKWTLLLAYLGLSGLFGFGDEDEEEGFDPDELWRQGYGFNNPNPERIRNGQPALNFDGSVAD